MKVTKEIVSQFKRKELLESYIGSEVEDMNELDDIYSDLCIEDEIRGSFACDLAGICSGMSCPRYAQCQG